VSALGARHLLRAQEILGHKWDLVILTQLGERSLRFKDLGRRIREIDSGFNDGVLSKTLRRLADDGLIYKQAVGKRHVHALTDLGREIVTILAQIAALHSETPDPDEPGPDERPDDPEQ
jgi:DNA-binding HxlR family transcriptional regulator